MPPLLSTWKQLIHEFSLLGGTCHNATLQVTEKGIRLVSIDPNEEVIIHVPDNLMILASDLTLKEDSVFLQKSSKYPAGYENWVQIYYQQISYGRKNAMEDIRNFYKGYLMLNKTLREKLEDLNILKFQKNIQNSTLNKTFFAYKFMETRVVTYKKLKHFFPIIELLNHDRQGAIYKNHRSLDKIDGMKITGHFSKEIFARYSHTDSLGKLDLYHFAALETYACSLPLSANYMNKFSIEVIQNSGFNPNATTYSVSFSEKKLVINSPLVLAYRDNPKIVRKSFKKSMSKYSELPQDDIFNFIVRQNIKCLVQLLRLMNSTQGDTEQTIKDAILNQIETLTYN